MPLDAQPRTALPPGLWRVQRAMRAPPERPPEILETLEDTPFYARSLVRAPLPGRLDGEMETWMHESLSCDRFARAWVRALLPFRMPRRAG